MKNVFYLVCILLFSSCFGNWDLGATVDESATEESTIYHYVRLDIMQNNKNLNFNSFANNHEEIIKKGEDHFVKADILELLYEWDHFLAKNLKSMSSKFTDKIEIIAKEENGYLVIEIHDDGSGYPDLLLESAPGEILNNINFQTGSTSLGIYFAEMVTRLHVQGDRKGSIKLSNGGSLGGGVFSIYLP